MASEASGHHLLKHALPTMERVIECFDGVAPKEIGKLVLKMGQRELQAKFNAVYDTVTRSNNNDWLRRKLLEAIGVHKPSNKGKASPKKGLRDNGLQSGRVTKPARVRIAAPSTQGLSSGTPSPLVASPTSGRCAATSHGAAASEPGQSSAHSRPPSAQLPPVRHAGTNLPQPLPGPQCSVFLAPYMAAPAPMTPEMMADQVFGGGLAPPPYVNALPASSGIAMPASSHMMAAAASPMGPFVAPHGYAPGCLPTVPYMASLSAVPAHLAAVSAPQARMPAFSGKTISLAPATAMQGSTADGSMRRFDADSSPSQDLGSTQTPYAHCGESLLASPDTLSSQLESVFGADPADDAPADFQSSLHIGDAQHWEADHMRQDLLIDSPVLPATSDTVSAEAEEWLNGPLFDGDEDDGSSDFMGLALDGFVKAAFSRPSGWHSGESIVQGVLTSMARVGHRMAEWSQELELGRR